MRVVVIGGKLQGVEATYLAKKANWEVALIDKNENAPAAKLCDIFYCIDVFESDKLLEIFKCADFVIPAVENIGVLETVRKCALQSKVPMAFDMEAYRISSSKVISDKLFLSLGIPVPKPWPLCTFPVIIKPSGASGSKDVRKINNEAELDKCFHKNHKDIEWVIQEYVEGPSFSLEVVSFKGKSKVLQVTELEMDFSYDCKRVIAPANISDEKKSEFEEISLKIADSLNMNGVFDVEVIYHDNKLKVLEIDARLPSQTPTAVFLSSGINILEELWTAYSTGEISLKNKIYKEKAVIYQHIKVTGQSIEVCGEHIMSDAGNLKLFNNFFGADEALSNFEGEKVNWVATLIITGENMNEVLMKRNVAIKQIMEYTSIFDYIDNTPFN